MEEYIIDSAIFYILNWFTQNSGKHLEILNKEGFDFNNLMFE